MFVCIGFNIMPFNSTKNWGGPGSPIHPCCVGPKIPIYTKADETLHPNASLGVTMSRTCLYPFYRCAVVITIRENEWELLSVVVDIHLFHVLSDTLISWSAGVRMKRL